MDEGEWRPLGVSDADEVGRYDALAEGIPPWLEQSFWTFIGVAIGEKPGAYELNVGLMLQYERVCRVQLGALPESASGAANSLRALLVDDQALELADFLLAAVPNLPSQLITEILQDAGSAWTVGRRAGRLGLVRRVPEGVQDSAEAAMRTPGRAGQDLRCAWEAIYGTSPNPGEAYRLAIRAVEHAAISVVVPNQDKATLGHVLSQMKQNGDWTLKLTQDPTKVPPPAGGLPLALVAALWEGQHDRHGGEPSVTGSVSQAEAEAAVSLAVSLVHWFATGMVQRR